MEGIMILNQWMVPGDAEYWLIAFGVFICMVFLFVTFEHCKLAFISGILAMMCFVCYLLPITNPWVNNYQVALNGATFEQLSEKYEVLKIEGSIFTVEEK